MEEVGGGEGEERRRQEKTGREKGRKKGRRKKREGIKKREEGKRGNKEKRGRKGVRIIPILFLWPSFHAAKWLPLL